MNGEPRPDIRRNNIRGRPVVAAVLAVLAALSLSDCGGGGGITIPPNPTPSIAAISPNSTEQGGQGFTLSVVGTNFIPGLMVHWNGTILPTTFVNNLLVTADVPASALTAPGPDAITVVNPAPGGGASTAMEFAVPCVIAPPAPAAAQTKARVGAFYFDGWSGALTHPHFNGLAFGPFQDRQPLSGWQDNSTCSIERQLAWAHNFGIDFFIFDWYFKAIVNSPDENLNSALQITHALPNRHGMQFAILYVDGGVFNVGPADWTSAVNEWVGYMTDPAYVRVNSKPLFVVLDVGGTRAAFGSSAAVAAALNQLRMAAIAQGLPGVYIVGNFGMPDGTLGQDGVTDGFSIAQSDGFDAISIWAYNYVAPVINGMQPYSQMSAAGHWTWDQARLHSLPLPFIPSLMDGWDPRPWNEPDPANGDLEWYSRTPQDVATLLNDAITWANANPQLRPELSPAPPLVFITSWDEMGEGNHILPTVGEGTSYGDAIAATLQAP